MDKKPSNLTLLLFIAFFFPASTALANDPIIESANASIKETNTFLSWLDTHKAEFASCEPKYKDQTYTLCDGTKITEKDLITLFKMTPRELINFIKGKDIKLEILCKDAPRKTFQPWCKDNVNRVFFKEVSSIHGQYITRENTIVLHSDAYSGSLVHEYLHYLQFINNNSIFGKIYKSERVKLENKLIKSMDDIILKVQELERQGLKEKTKTYLPTFVELSTAMMKFSFWQKLIDERNLFLLFIEHQQKLAIAKEDILLAKKNMGFICSDNKIAPLLPKQECH